jgi:hypothetical protein
LRRKRKVIGLIESLREVLSRKEKVERKERKNFQERAKESGRNN